MRYRTPAALEMAVKAAAKASPLDTNLAISETLSPLAPQLAYMTLLGHADLFRTSFSGYVAHVKVAHRLGQHVPCGKCRLLADVYVDLDVTEYSSAGSASIRPGATPSS